MTGSRNLCIALPISSYWTAWNLGIGYFYDIALNAAPEAPELGEESGSENGGVSQPPILDLIISIDDDSPLMAQSVLDRDDEENN
jgi:hypothetical protein